MLAIANMVEGDISDLSAFREAHNSELVEFKPA